MSRAPRVLVLGSVLSQPMGGVRRHAAELLPRAAALLEQGGGALSVLEGREPLAFTLPGSVRHLRSRVPARPAWRRALAEPAAVRAALIEARDEGRGFDLVHTGHQPVPGPAALGGTPLVTTIHDLRRLDPNRSGRLRAAVARRVFAAAAAHSACLVFVSEHVRQAFAARFPDCAPRTCVVPNAADHLALPDGPEAPPHALEPGYLLHVGHLEPRKNLDLLLEALALAPELPPLVLAGAAVGGERARLERAGERLGLGTRVRFLGALEERHLAPLYVGASCVVVPSTLEGFGLAAEEARRLRVRLAVARAGALPEVAGDGAASFAPDDAGDCVRAIRAALTGPPPEPSERSWDASARALVAAWRAASAPGADARRGPAGR